MQNNLHTNTTEELFYICIDLGIIYPMDDFEEWENERDYMIKLIQNRTE